MNDVVLPSLWLASLLAVPAASILSPGDVIFGYDLDSNSATPGSGNEDAVKGSSILSPGNPAVATSWDSNFPGGESASNVIDGTSGQKYLNFGKENAAFWVVPAMGPSIVQSFTLTTANDSPERDPASFRLLGQAADGSWNLIDAGPLSLTDDREVESAPIVVANSTAYNAYRMEFDSLKDGGAANSMQIGEVQFFDVVPEPSTSILAAGGLLGLLIRRRRH